MCGLVRNLRFGYIGVVGGQATLFRGIGSGGTGMGAAIFIGSYVEDSHIAKLLLYADHCIIGFIVLVICDTFIVFRC